MYSQSKDAYNGLKYPVVARPYTDDMVVKEVDVLDKIRDEIMDTGAYEQEVHGKTEFLKGINYCLGVIDKYKTENEDK